MKKRLLTIALGLLFSVSSIAQISEGGIPKTFEKNHLGQEDPFEVNYEIVQVARPDVEAAIEEDSRADKTSYRIGLNTDVNISIQSAGSWIELGNGDKIWRLGIRSAGAKAINLYFASPVKIPEGGELYAYNENQSQYVGAYTSNTPGFQALEMIEGEVVTLEYYMPAGSYELPTIQVSEIGHLYRGVQGRIGVFQNGNSQNQHRADACQVDVACSEITGFEEQRDAVVHYSFVAGGTYVCTGSVINNAGTSTTCIPYILSANHCGEPDASNDISNHVWYFNYQRPSCSPGNTSPYNGAQSETMSGGSFRASSSLGNYTGTQSYHVDGSDFVLVELNSAIPTSYDAYYAGWNRATAGSGSGVGIHHPSGDEKKVSTYTSSLSSATYNGNWAGAHWDVNWVSTTNGNGVTEGGSSGSPLFNSSGQIVGHLSGGLSACVNGGAGAGTGPNESDLYGKFINAWDMEGTSNNQQLAHWLDPDGTNAMTLDGTYSPCGNGGGGGGGGGGTDPCAASGTSDCTAGTASEYISRVTLESIDNGSDCSGYTDYTSQSTTLTKGSQYTVTIEPGVAGTGPGQAYTDDEIAVWIDWNNDADFDDPGEQVGYVLVGGTWSSAFDFTVPTSASSGDLTMRCRISYQPDDGAITPCGTTQWGEVEDYTITIPGVTSLDNEDDLGNVVIFPNPTNGDVTLNFAQVQSDVESVELRDMTGRLIAITSTVGGTVKFDLSNEASGVYLIKVNGLGTSLTKKITKF